MQGYHRGPEVRAEDQSWLPRSRKPGWRQIRKMVGCLVSVACRLVMKNHFYSYNNQIRKQGKGGAIGNSLTQRFGQLLMKRFDRKNNMLLKKLKIQKELSKTFVDDNMTALKALDPGVRYDPDQNKMVIKPELVESDKALPSDRRTMEELRKIANTVYKCVQFTTDCPSSNRESMMPVLDL